MPKFIAVWKCSTCGDAITEPAVNLSPLPDTLGNITSFMLKHKPTTYHECKDRQLSIAYLACVFEVESETDADSTT